MKRYFVSILIFALAVSFMPREETHELAQRADAQPLPFSVYLGSLRTPGATKTKLLKDLGGNDKSEAAVAAGLKWIVSRQTEDGSWELLTADEEAKKPYPADSKVMRSVAGTALAILPLLGHGEMHKHQRRQYPKNVERGLEWLLDQQRKDGGWSASGYEHALATLTLCEAYGLTADPLLKEPAQRAVKYIVTAQHEKGGWRYQPKQAGDTSVTGWQVQALFAAAYCGLEIPKEIWPAIMKFLDAFGNADGSVYGYQESQKPSPSMTASALWSRQWLRWPRTEPGMVKGIEYLEKTPPSKDLQNIYYYYHATNAIKNYGGEPWQRWNPRMRDLLIETQEAQGSWKAEGDAWGPQLGRLGCTSLALLTLEVYYRYGPIYRLEPK
jgi:hypothetical protein